MAKKPTPPQERNEPHLVAFLRQARGDVDTEFQGTKLAASEAPPATVTLTAPALPAVYSRFAQLERLKLLREDVLFSILAAVQFDPHYIYRALQPYLENWTFDPQTCSMMSILAKEGGATIALMQLDLFSDDIVFVARKSGKLEVVGGLAADKMLAVMRQPGTTPAQVWDWFQLQMAEIVKIGKAG